MVAFRDLLADYAVPLALSLVCFGVLLTLVVRLSVALRRFKRMTGELEASETLRRTLLENAPIVLWAIDSQGFFTLSTGSGLAALGLKPGEVVGKNAFEVYQDNEEICRQTRLALEGTSTVAIVKIGQSWFEMKYATQYDEAGKVTGAIGVALDVTVQTQAQAMQRHLALAVEASAQAIILTDSKGDIQYVNKAFEQITGYPRQEVLGRNTRILKSGMHDDIHYKNIWVTISSGKTWTGRFQNRRKNGVLYHEDATITPLLDDKGIIQGYIAVKRDITKEVRAEESVRQAQRLEAIGKLAGGIAHDFNNILQVIHTNVSFALEPQNSPSEQTEFLQNIQQSTTRATALTRQLLAFGGRQTLHYELLDPAQGVADVLKLIRRTLGEDIQIEFNPQRGIDRIRGDQGQLDQVLLNLCVNARDAMKGGGRLTIDLRNVQLSEQDMPAGQPFKPGRHIELVVSDTGIGMDEATKAHIFEPFFTTKGTGRGTGLGLPVVQGIVRQHEGHLFVDSTPGKGTRITIRLPSLEARDDDEVGMAEEIELQGAVRHSGHETVLIAEDDENVRLAIQTLLARHGYKVLTASDGEEACEVSERWATPIDILVFDVVMPKLGGIPAAERILKNRPGIPVILCSGYAGGVSDTDELPDRSWKLVNKPYHGADLLKQIRSCLDLKP